MIMAREFNIESGEWTGVALSQTGNRSKHEYAHTTEHHDAAEKWHTSQAKHSTDAKATRLHKVAAEAHYDAIANPALYSHVARMHSATAHRHDDSLGVSNWKLGIGAYRPSKERMRRDGRG